MSGLTGLAKGLDAYLGTAYKAQNESALKKQETDYSNQAEYARQTQLKQDEAALKPKLTFGQLKTINPALANLGLKDDENINYEHLNELASVLPKESGVHGGADKFATIPEAKLWLKMGGVPDNKIDSILNTKEAQKIGRVPLSLLDDHIKGQSTSLMNLKDTVNMLRQNAEASGEEITPDQLISKAIELQDELKNVGNGKSFLPPEGVGQAADTAIQLLDAEQEKGTPPVEALKKVFAQVQSAYTPQTAKKVIAELNKKIESEKKEEKPGLIKKLFGGK